MKSYIILALLVGIALSDGTCVTFKCASITDANTCVGQTATAVSNVQTCPSGMACNTLQGLNTIGFNAVINTLTAASITCATVNPVDPVYTGKTGDICSVDGDCKGQGAKCTNKVCVTTNVAGADCANSNDCALGFYCNAQKCAAIIAPGQPCTGNDALSEQCGYNGYCIGLKCALQYSLPAGTVLASGTTFQSVCASGYAGPEDGA